MFTFNRIDVADLPVLCAIAERTFRDAWQQDNEPEAFEQYCQTAFSADTLRQEMEQTGSIFYLTCVDDVPAAYLKLNFNRPLSELEGSANVQVERIYVLATFQSQGLGTHLLRFADQCAREAGADWLWLSVWQKSPRTIEFYRKNGFHIFGTEIFWLGEEPQSDWLMKRRLSA